MVVNGDDRARREALRHLLATIAYRGAKVLRDAPEGFGTVSAGGGARSAVEILAHMGDLPSWPRSTLTWPETGHCCDPPSALPRARSPTASRTLDNSQC